MSAYNNLGISVGKYLRKVLVVRRTNHVISEWKSKGEKLEVGSIPHN